MNSLPPEIYDLLKNALDENIENFSITVQDNNQKGEGFLGDFCYVSLKEKGSSKALDFAVKQAFADEGRRTLHPIRRYYLNEIYFYTKVWPRFQKFQTEFGIRRPFDKIPKCIVTSSEEGKEKIVLENLKHQKFKVHPKKQPFDKKQVEYTFRQYGKFHGISFAHKLLRPQEYTEISKELPNLFYDICELKSLQHYVKYIHDLCLKTLDKERDSEAIEKYRPYIENGMDIFREMSVYKGDYSVILHGDCWSNNMMFKYSEDNEVIDMRLLDFQFCSVGTPVSDLSYCLYSAASKEILDDLDHFLRIYHRQLLDTLEEFGCNSKEVYPFEELKKDWKLYCKTGFTMALLVWRAKMTYDNEIADLADIKDDGDINKSKEAGYDEEGFKMITRDLLRHMYENDFL